MVSRSLYGAMLLCIARLAAAANEYSDSDLANSVSPLSPPPAVSENILLILLKTSLMLWATWHRESPPSHEPGGKLPKDSNRTLEYGISRMDHAIPNPHL